jgi:MFS transporter, PPP family, 3-phenylpropionic acid transporter
VRNPGPFGYIVLYAAIYGAFGVASPFWPKFFETRGLTSQQIALILSAAMLVRLAAGPAVGRLADLWRSLRLVLAACIAMAAAMAATLLLANTFWPLLLIALMQAAALAPITSIADALSVNAAKPQRAGKPFEYGWIRGSGSAAFVLGTLIIGQIITGTDVSPVVWMNVALLMAAAAATALVPPVTDSPKPHGTASPAALNVLFGMSRFRMLVAVSALVYGSHAMHDAFSVIRWSDAGMNTSVISVLWSEAVAAEVIVFFVIGPALLDRLGARGAAVLAAAAGIVRWSISGMTTSFLALTILQPLHGLTFALLHLACMRIMGSLAPTSLAATAQATYAFGSGFSTAALTLFSGSLYARYGGAAFFPMAALCGLALPLAWFGLAERPQSQL